MKPTIELMIDCYVYSDFTILWSYEYNQDSNCVRSRTGFLITAGSHSAI